MTILIKAGSGLVAGIVAGALGLAFLPRVEPNGVKPRSAVEKPLFVSAAATSPPIDQSAPRATPALAVAAQTPEAKPSPEASHVEAAPVASASAAPVASVKPEPPKAAPSPMAVADIAPSKAVPAPSPAASPVAEARAAATTAQPAASEASARWSVRGLVALAKGDLSSARLFLARAADEGDPRALVALADTYDPAMLTKLGVVGAPGDLQRTKDYLAKAAAAGVVVAKDRMAAIDQDSHNVH